MEKNSKQSTGSLKPEKPDLPVKTTPPQQHESTGPSPRGNGDLQGYLKHRWDFIPISAALIEHVRRIDGFNEDELCVLKRLLTAAAKKLETSFKFDRVTLQDAGLRRFLEIVLKLHQILALVDVSFEPVLPAKTMSVRSQNLPVHFHEIVEELQEHNGLNYVPRERSNDGRMFEHAADSRILIDHLLALDDSKPKYNAAVDAVKGPEGPQNFYIRLVDEPVKGGKDDVEHETTTTKKFDQRIFRELAIKDDNVIMVINKAFLELAMKANGKADLYFHAYFWDKYLHDLQTTANAAGSSQFEKIDLKGKGAAEKYPFVPRLSGLATTLSKVILNVRKFPFTEANYQKYVAEFASRSDHKKQSKLEQIQRALFVAQIADDQEALRLIEKLLIALQGYCDITIRDQVVVLLNMLYDGVDWQIPEAFRPVVRSVGQHFRITTIVHKKAGVYSDKQLYIGLGAPSPIDGNNNSLLTWHKIEARNIVNEDKVMAEISINFGKFWKCGFYDWRLVSISSEGKLAPLEIIGKPEPVYPTVCDTDFEDHYEAAIEDEVGCIAQGRFIVHARGMRDHSFHEVQVDLQDARVDKQENQFIQRGTFSDVERNVGNYAKQGITALYLMGTLERDNYPFQNQHMATTQYRKEDASPLAAIDRATPNKMLGGKTGLRGIMKQAKQHRVKVIVDSLARISSSRFNRKYKDLLLHYLDEDGRRHIAYGTDGQAQKFEDTAMLNYRKLEAWDLLIDEVVSYCQEYGFDGIHLDNGQAWPQILEPDVEELSRIDVDGQPAYTPEEFLNADVVIRNENYGYWNTNNMETYANPFFIKLCRKLWQVNPDFMILGECWGGFMFEHRQIILARSGVIPRLFKLPIALSSLFGKKLHRDGRVEPCAKDNVIAVKKWYDETHRFLPNGAILLQSSTSHALPYPAYLYGKGTWAAIDILFFMPDQPITLMGELDGDIYRVGDQRTVFQHEQAELKESPTELKRSNSQIMKALTGDDTTTIGSETTAGKPDASLEKRRGMIKVASGLNIGANYQEAQEGQLGRKEQQFKESLAPQEGFDLSKIHTHYSNRRQLRKQKMVLRYGELIMLAARDHDFNFMNDILVFARYSLMETVIIATSLCDHNKSFNLDMSQLLPTLKKTYPNNTIVMVKNIISDEKEPEYFFLREFVELRQLRQLPAYRSLMISVTICDDDQFIFKKCLTDSIERTKRNLLAHRSIETEQISLLFSDCIEHEPQNIARFANVIGSIQTSFLDKLNVSFRDLFVSNRKLSSSVELSARLTAMTGYIIKKSGGQIIAPTRAAKAMHDSNILGPIIFCTPELGRWSTVGGLGVMVDELAIGLADLGQDVYVISPYYERNRKGQTGYLAQDPAGIHYKDNLHVDIGGGCTLGIHEGVVKGVKVIFLHNGDIFPSPYPDASVEFVTNQIAVFGKACLEFCCKRQIIPAMCITNDWFTGFVAAYAKIGHFGETFKGTCFLHICHNLQESYEGRIHLDPKHGDLGGIHQLPRDWLIDPQWKGVMINPSRCAIMLSDQWATVSKSYREDLLNSSTLAWLLRQKPQPFAFPNGIPIKERVNRLDKAAPDHKSAKRILQQRYFNFQDLDDSVPLFGFVGRIVAQKGVMLILDIAEHIIHKFNYKVQFLIAGPANMKDPYAAACAHRLWALKNQYPHCFWAAPEEFFTDGALVNRGSDFGLMPSVFEPGGIVQHEFFVGGTPVIAFKTGGLKDSVLEYNWDSEEGSGYTFESHTTGDCIFAMERAIGTFRNKPKYLKLRENAFKATMDGDVVSRAWLAEFYRLRGKIFVDYTVVDKLNKQFEEWSPADYQPISIIQEIFGADKKREVLQDLDHGATEEEVSTATGSPDKMMEIDMIMSAFDAAAYNKKPKTFTFQNRGPRHSRVELCGSFDEWQVRHELSFDPFTNQWFVTLHLKPGQDFFYKYILDNDNWVMNEDERKADDGKGNINNVCNIAM